MKRYFLIVINIILISICIYSFIDFLFGFIHPSHVLISWIALVVAICSPVYIVLSLERYYGYSLALLTYLILTQFGTCIVVYAIPLVNIVSRGYYNTDWIYSSTYPKATELGILAVICYSFSVVWTGLRQDKVGRKHLERHPINNFTELSKRDVGVVYIGTFLVYLALAYTTLMIVTGEINIFGSYEQFWVFINNHATSWSMIIVLYATGFIFVVAAGNSIQIKKALVPYTLMAIILLITGNKGEVFYAVLTALGVYISKKQKIDTKFIIFALIAFFIIIPSISTLRGDGVLHSLKSFGVNFANPFIETGSQIRLSVFIIDEIKLGVRNYLYGFSYYNPIINIINRAIPFIPRLNPPVSFDFNTSFANMGFSQVAESYANFGTTGVIVFFTILGYITSRFDSLKNNRSRKALYGGWLVIFINMTRNSFAFVPGQMIIVYALWVISQIVGNSLKKKGDYKNEYSSCFRKNGPWRSRIANTRYNEEY